MNIQEEIDELKAKIEVLEKELQVQNQPCAKRWRGCQKQEYWAINDKDGHILAFEEWGDEMDNYRYITGNYFKTEEEAEEYKENFITKQKLKDLALRLNKGVEFDWKDMSQGKYFIYYLYNQGLRYHCATRSHYVGQIYCLDENFLHIATQEIGEEALIKLIKSGI